MRDINPQSSRQIGLRRLWLVLSICWIVLVGLFVALGRSEPIKEFILFGLIPVAALYALIAGINWVIEGFRSGH